MLVLTRRVGQSIIIGANAEITVTIAAITTLPSGRVQAEIAIEADKDIPVDREEIYYRKQQEKISPKEQPHDK